MIKVPFVQILVNARWRGDSTGRGGGDSQLDLEKSGIGA